MTSVKRSSHLCLLTSGLLIMSSYHSALANHPNIINNAVIDLSKPMPQSLLTHYNREGIEFDYDNTPVLKQVLVINREGINAQQLPSGASRKVTSYGFGEKLEVIEDRESWYGVRDRIYREYDKDNDGIIETEVVKWEKVYVKKDQTGSIDNIALTANDLNLLAYLSVGEDYENFEEDKALNNYLKIELIDKATFEKKRSLAVDFLTKNNQGFRKENGVLSILTASKISTFTNNDVDNEGYEIYDYIGQIDTLNQHLVNGNYWESYDYIMIDKDTGETTQKFIDYPYISPDKKYVVAAYANPYEQYTDFELYKVDNDEIVPVMFAGFKNWMPAIEPKDIFWARNGYLYLAVTHSRVFWKEDGNYNDNFQYIRIKVDL